MLNNADIMISIITVEPQKGRDKPEDVKALAWTMDQHGLLNPLTVSLGPANTYILHAGRRRLAAAKQLGWKSISCRVMKEGANTLAVTMIENQQRIEVDPFDEVDLFEKILKDTGDIEALAIMVGQSVAYVHARLALGNLPKQAQELWKKGWLTKRHLVLLAEMPTKEMAETVLEEIDATEWQSAKPPDRLVKDIIERYGHKLAKATFDIKDKDLVPEAGACVTCPKQTGKEKQVTLFVEMNESGICLDPACWKVKCDAAQKLQIETIEAKGENVMDAQTMKKELGPTGTRLSFGSSFVDLSQKLEEFDYKIAAKNKGLARKQLKTILKSFLKSTMNIPMEDGRMVLAARKLEVRQAMRDAKLNMAKEEPVAAQKTAEKLQQKKRKAVRMTVSQLMGYIGDKKVGAISHKTALWMVMNATYRSGFDVLNRVCLRRKWVDKGKDAYDSKLHELVVKKAKELPTDQRIALAFEVMAAHYEPLQDGSMNKPMKFSEEAFGFKVQSVYEDNMRAMAPKHKRKKR